MQWELRRTKDLHHLDGLDRVCHISALRLVKSSIGSLVKCSQQMLVDSNFRYKKCANLTEFGMRFRLPEKLRL